MPDDPGRPCLKPDGHRIDRGHIVEIGSGSGEFLQQICELSDSRGTGFDPSYDPRTSVAPASERLTIMTEPFTGGAIEQADLVLARHVLEHVEDPPAVLRDVRAGATALAGEPPVSSISKCPTPRTCSSTPPSGT